MGGGEEGRGGRGVEGFEKLDIQSFYYHYYYYYSSSSSSSSSISLRERINSMGVSGRSHSFLHDPKWWWLC